MVAHAMACLFSSDERVAGSNLNHGVDKAAEEILLFKSSAKDLAPEAWKTLWHE